MRKRYLQVSYRNGKPLAAYLYLPRQSSDRSARVERREQGLLVDYAADGRPIGIEITAPTKTSLSFMNQLLTDLNQQAATADELAPLLFTGQDSRTPA
jgi:hypothetical protein